MYILDEKILDRNVYPFTVPAINSLHTLELKSRVCFFTGENGSGKSTLLEAIAAHYGFGREGGSRNYSNSSTEKNNAIDPLVSALRLSFDIRTRRGFFLRAESFFNVATHIDELDKEPFAGPTIISSMGGVSMHDQSHGQSFFALLTHRFRSNGLFLLDEPEAALSPQRQLAFLALVHDSVSRYPDAQFIVSTHSPILLGYPGAQIFSFDRGDVHEIAYGESMPVQVMSDFLAHREAMLEELFNDISDSAPGQTNSKRNHFNT
ncbi:MAG: AAA family ATPase [Acidobacteria bacterium]|nr:AAA family ATPase [Acidobacteriota bacterium]